MSETVTMTLTDFLLARIAEDEAMARRIAPYVEGDAVIQVRLYRSEKLPDGSERRTSETVTPYHPKRAVAECEAKRRIVERHSGCGTGHGYCDDGGHGWGGDLPLGCADLADLGTIHAEHPDYRDEWRP